MFTPTFPYFQHLNSQWSEKNLFPKRRKVSTNVNLLKLMSNSSKRKKYKITLKMMMHEGEQKRFTIYPFPWCGKSFRSNRTANAFLNKHLNILYLCVKYEFVMRNLDLFCNHICFAYSSACKTMKRRDSPAKPKTGGVKKVKLEQPVEKDVIILDDE